METFTEILNNFITVLEKIPENLKPMAFTLLFFLNTIEIALTVYTNIDNENFSYYKYLKSKILKIGFIIFAINKYEWLLEGVKSFFLEIGTRGLGLSLTASDYFNQPSKIVDKGTDLWDIFFNNVGARPSTWGYILLGAVAVIAFFMIAIKIIIVWIEFYFLTGISLIFLPFGALDMTGELYKNVFKTIISCSIKLCVFNIWILASDKIFRNLLNNSEKITKYDNALIICGTVYILVAVIQTLPSLTTGLLTGSPAVNAGQAMSSAMAAGMGVATGVANTYRGLKEAGKEAWKGGQTGANVGGAAGTALGSLAGPVGMSVGKIVGGTIGAVGGATVAGSYAGARYAIFKEKAKDKVNNGNSNNTSSEGFSGSSSSSGGSSNNSFTSQNPSNSSGGSNLGSSPQSPSNNPPSGSSGEGSSPGGGNNGGSPSNSFTSQTPSNSSGSSNLGSSPQSPSNNLSLGGSSGNNSPGNENNGGSPNNSNDSTNSVADNSIPANTNTDTTNNVSESSTNTPSTTSTDTSTSSENGENVTTDTGNSSKKRGIKVNGGESGKIPDWMDGDYYK